MTLEFVADDHPGVLGHSINYLDRQTLSVVRLFLIDQFKMTNVIIPGIIRFHARLSS